MAQVNSSWGRRSCPSAVQLGHVGGLETPVAPGLQRKGSGWGNYAPPTAGPLQGSLPRKAGSLHVAPPKRASGTFVAPVRRLSGASSTQPAAPLYGKRSQERPSVATTTTAASSGGGSPCSVYSPIGTFAPMVSDVPIRLSAPRASASRLPQAQQEDPHLRDLQELRKASRLAKVPAVEGLSALRLAAAGRRLTRERFLECYAVLMQSCGIAAPPRYIQDNVFEFFDKDRTNIVDNTELLFGLLFFFSGTDEEKIRAVFSVFDVNGGGYITIDELFAFLTAIFKMLLTERVKSGLVAMGLPVERAEDLASIASVDCFMASGIEFHGRLSLPEFRRWFDASGVGGDCPYSSLLQGLW